MLKSALRLAMQVAFYLIDLLQDDHTEVVKAADQALTVISEVDESWGAKLRALKFEAHNQIWLEACANGAPQQVSCSRNNLAIHSEMIRLAKHCLYMSGLCGASVHILRETEGDRMCTRAAGKGNQRSKLADVKHCALTGCGACCNGTPCLGKICVLSSPCI